MSIILAIESSCDETSASIINNGKVLNNVISTQSIHEIYGGVVPELASRAHLRVIQPVVDSAMQKAGVKKSELDAVAYAKGPGLLGSLLVGSSFAKSMSLALNIPLIGVNHMKAHILAHFIDDPKPEFPFLCLTVSGGHTQLVVVNSEIDMEIIGETKDDAVGEAFDKCAKMMGLPYPGGPLIDQYAQQGDPKAFRFSKTAMPELEFSFSGIKTGFLYFLRREKEKNDQFIDENMHDISASIQYHLIDMLLEKLELATQKTGIKRIAIAGGVSANSELRKRLTEWGKSPGFEIFVPAFQYCTDNAGMIAMAAHFLYKHRIFETLEDTPNARLSFN